MALCLPLVVARFIPGRIQYPVMRLFANCVKNPIVTHHLKPAIEKGLPWEQLFVDLGNNGLSCGLRQVIIMISTAYNNVHFEHGIVTKDL